MCGNVSWASCLTAGGQLLIVTQMISAALSVCVCVCQLGSGRLVSFIAADTQHRLLVTFVFMPQQRGELCKPGAGL